MTQTENLKLNLWAPTDAVNLGQMNDNFQKVDTGVANASPVVTLLDVTTTQACRQVDLDVSGLNLCQYYMTLLLPKTTVGCNLRCNNLSRSGDYYSNSTANENLFYEIWATTLPVTSSSRVELYVRPEAILARLYKLGYYPESGFTGRSDLFGGVNSACLNGSNLKTLNIYSLNANISIPAGSRFRLLGVRL